MIEQIKDHISKELKESFELDYDSIKSKVSNILSNYTHLIEHFRVVCDQSNNRNNKFIYIDVFFEYVNKSQIYSLNITFTPDRIKALKKLRHKKLNNIFLS